jgi:hypothetical protein
MKGKLVYENRFVKVDLQNLTIGSVGRWAAA